MRSARYRMTVYKNSERLRVRRRACVSRTRCRSTRPVAHCVHDEMDTQPTGSDPDTGKRGARALIALALRHRTVRLAILLCSLLIVVIWVSIAAQLRSERKFLVDRAVHETASYARSFEEHVLRTISAAEFALRHIAREYQERGAAVDLVGLARGYGPFVEPYTVFSITDERGNLIVASEPFKATNYSERESFRHHAANDRGELFISKPQIGTATGKVAIYLSRRMNKRDGSFGGVVAVGLNPLYFSKFYDQIELGPDAAVALSGYDGIIRARRSNQDLTVGQDLSGFETFRAMKGRRAGHFFATRTLDGVTRIFSYRVLDAYPLIVQVGVSQNATLAPYYRLRHQFVAWALLITALVVLFAGVLITHVSRQARFASALRASESRYRSFIDATSQIVCSANAAGQIVEDSPTWRQYTGQTYEEYTGAGWLAAVHPADRDRVAAAWVGAIAGESACESEYRLRGADGVFRTVRCRAAPVRNDDGSVREWVTVLNDLSEMELAEAALRASESRLRAILDAEPEGVLLLDPECRVLEMNQAGLATLQIETMDSLREHSLLDFVAERHRTVVAEAAAAVFDGEDQSFTFELVGARGARRWLEAHCVPLRDGGEEATIVALLGVARDITQQKQAQDALIASRKRQQDILNSIYAFVGLFATDGVLVEANDAPFAVTGGKGSRATGRYLWDDYGWSYSPQVQERLKDALARAAHGEIVRYDEAVRLSEESYVTVDIQFAPLRGADGRVSQVVAFAVDISERKKAEAERAHLAQMVQSSDDAIISRSLDHRILSWNTGAEHLFGYAAEEVLGRELSLLVAPERMDRYLDMRAISSGGKPLAPHENTCVAKNGRRIDVWVSASSVHDERGERVAVSLILRDITEQKKLEAAQRLASSVLESAAEGIMITDRNKNIVAVNRAFTEITGFTAEDAIGKDPRLLSSAAHPSSPYEAVWQAVNETGRWRGELWDRRKNGELYCELLSLAAVCDERGGITHYCAIMMDVTQRKAAEAELQRLNAELEDRVAARTRQLESANKELASFSYSVSHDLRAPVRAIEGFSALVLEKAAARVDAETVNRLNRIRDNAQRMGSLIDDLLRLSRVSQREIERRNFDFTALATEAVSNLRRGDGQRPVDVLVKPGMVTNGDPTLIQLVLDNLLGNAWKFTGRTPQPRIEVGEEQRDGKTVYFVRDNGAGFDMQYAGKLFNAFQRLHHREEFDGTGIGLSIVHRVVIKHGGRVWADARVGEGATFFFTLS